MPARGRGKLHAGRQVGHGPDPTSTDGEAANPGPDEGEGPSSVILASANMTSAYTHIDAIVACAASVQMIQESKLTDEAQLEFAREECLRGWSMVFGAPLEHPHESNGVAVLARPGVVMRKVPPQGETGRVLWASKRFCHAVIVLEDVVLHCISLYGFTNSATCRESREKNEALLQQVFSYLAEFGDVSIVIGADFNIDPLCSNTLFTAQQTRKWADAAQLQFTLDGHEPEKTCFVRETSKGSRIDGVFLSQGIAPAFQGLKVSKLTGVPTHRQLELTLDKTFARQEGMRFKTPAAFPDASEWKDPDKDAE